MAIATSAGLLAALPGQQAGFQKTGAWQNGGWISPWLVAGQPAAGVAPSSGLAGDIPTNLTLGAIPFVNPAGGSIAYLARAIARVTVLVGHVALYDRLWHNSGLSATSTSGQTINSVALNRPDVNGNDVEAWWQVYASMGSGTPTVTLAYTSSAGNVRTDGSSGVLATGMLVGRTGPFRLSPTSGDTGVKSIQTWTASATFTSGTIGLVLRRRIADFTSVYSGQDIVADALACGLASIPANACLELVVMSGLTTTMPLVGELSFVEG